MYLTDKAPGEAQTVAFLPSTKNLVWLLRNPQHWPPGFEWDYRDTRCCAIGLASRAWGICPSSVDFAQLLNIDSQDAYRIVVQGNRFLGCRRTSPKQIARALERL